MTDRMIVLYDADCAMCSRLVRFIINRDKRHSIRFAPLLSSQVTKALMVRLAADHPEKLPDSLIVIEGGLIYTHSTAALRITRLLSGGWRFAYAFILVPRPIRDVVYRLVATYRYALFGRSIACSLPDDGFRSRLLSDEEAADMITSVS